MNIDFTKFSRPLVVFGGVFVGILNYCLLPLLFRLLNKNSAPFDIPNSVIMGWFSYIGLYSVGRTFEKGKGSENKQDSEDENK